jgi:hypothetical protein
MEVYGIPVESTTDLSGDARADLLALVAFLSRGDSDRDIAAGLLGNGLLPLDNLPEYVVLVKNMRSEVLTWLRARGSTFLMNEIRAC